MGAYSGASGGLAIVMKRLRRQIGAASASVAVALLIVAATMSDTFVMRSARDLIFDSYQRVAPRAYDASLPVRVVAIDEAALKAAGQWPWPRTTLVTLVERLREAGAAAIAFDVIFSEAERGTAGAGAIPSGTLGEADRAFRDAIAGGRVIIGQALIDIGAEPVVKPGLASGGDDPRLFMPRFGGAIVPLPDLANAADGVGALNWLPDRDLIVRRVPLLFNVNGQAVPSFVVEALRVAQGAQSLFVRSSNASGEEAFDRKTGINAVRIGQAVAATDPDVAVRIRFAGSRPERHVSAAAILDGSFDRSRIEGAIVLIGATAVGLSDIRATALEPAVAGIDIHAELLEHLLMGETLARPDYAPGLEALTTVAAAVLTSLSVALFSPVGGALAGLLLLVGAVGVSFGSFLQASLLIDPIGPTLGTISAFAIGATGALRRSRREQREIRAAFSRYVSPAVVEALAADPSRLKLGGELREITVLFSDIRGFTSRSETLEAHDVVRFLNDIHTPLTEEVLNSQGTLDKFIGDGMMAFWNAPLDTPDHVRKALTCAIAMQRVTRALDASLAAEAAAAGRPHYPIEIGLGVHTGIACIGNLGSDKRFDYSAVGDSVNTAARIEQSCKTYGASMLISAEVAAAAPEFAAFPIDLINLKGKSRGTRLYALHGGPELRDAAFEEFQTRMAGLVDGLASRASGLADEIEALAAHPIGRGYQGLFALYRARIVAARERVDVA